MAETTQIHPDKVRAYLATDYRLGHTAQDIVLTIGKRSDRLAAMFAAKGVNCGAFLTAYNPRGTLQPEAANHLAHAQLATQLAQLGHEVVAGSGSAAGGDRGPEWAAEESYFALGMALETAKAMGTHFDQDAIVWVGADAEPQLVLLR